jgi:hypothetical protein
VAGDGVARIIKGFRKLPGNAQSREGSNCDGYFVRIQMLAGEVSPTDIICEHIPKPKDHAGLKRTCIACYFQPTTDQE